MGAAAHLFVRCGLAISLLEGCSVEVAPPDAAPRNVPPHNATPPDAAPPNTAAIEGPPPSLTAEDERLLAADPATLTRDERRQRAHALRRKILQNPDSPAARALEQTADAVRNGTLLLPDVVP